MKGKLNGFTKDNTFLLVDFDFTITTGKSASGFSLFRRGGLLGKEYDKQVTKLFHHYHPFEIDHNLTPQERSKLMLEWHTKAFESLKEFGLTEEVFEQTIHNTHDQISIRDGVQTLFQKTQKLGIPIVLYSAGIKKVIQRVLEGNSLMYPHLLVEGNELDFGNNGLYTGVNLEHFIFPTAKTWERIHTDIKSGVKNRTKIVLLGDMMDDITMAPKEHDGLFKVGVVNHKSVPSRAGYEEVYDVLIQDDDSDLGVFSEVVEQIEKN